MILAEDAFRPCKDLLIMFHKGDDSANVRDMFYIIYTQGLGRNTYTNKVYALALLNNNIGPY